MSNTYTTYVMQMPTDPKMRSKFVGKLNDLADKFGVELVAMSLHDEISWEEYLRNAVAEESSMDLETLRTQWEKNQ